MAASEGAINMNESTESPEKKRNIELNHAWLIVETTKTGWSTTPLWAMARPLNIRLEHQLSRLYERENKKTYNIDYQSSACCRIGPSNADLNFIFKSRKHVSTVIQTGVRERRGGLFTESDERELSSHLLCHYDQQVLSVQLMSF